MSNSRTQPPAAWPTIRPGNLYLVQPNYSTGSGQFQSHWLPYSVGCLWAYARQFDDIAARYTLRGLVYERLPIDQAVDRMADPAVVGFSNYVWNFNYNRALAEAVKRRWPNAFIVFGGPEVPDDPGPLFASAPWLDATVHKEGELAFVALLRALAQPGASPTGIAGVCWRAGAGITATPSGGRIADLSALPSPYLTGVFDELLRDRPGTAWAATLETTRGCPYKCRFCDWGSAVFTKVNRFPLERVDGELGWLAANRVEYVFMADANFGIFAERDAQIADCILAAVERTGYPRTFNIQWAKNSNLGVARLARKLAAVQKGLTLSVQSMSEPVLDAVERRNMAISDLGATLAACEHENLPAYTELILGLPGETLASWKQGLHRLLELGQHCAIDVWIAQILRNSALGSSAEIERHGIETVEASGYFMGVTVGDAIPESIRLVRATRTMPFGDLIEAYLYAWMVLNFHLYGWTQLAARFLSRLDRLDYGTFYGRLFAFIRGGRGIISEQYERTRQRISAYLTTGQIGGNLADEIGIDLEIFGHNLLWLSQMVFRYHARAVLEELRPFLLELEPGLSPACRRDLVRAQASAVILHDQRYPCELALESNLVDVALSGALLDDAAASRYRVDYRPEVRAAAGDLAALAPADFLYLLYYKRRIGPGMATFERLGDSPNPALLDLPAPVRGEQLIVAPLQTPANPADRFGR